MAITVEAVYEGGVLKPVRPLELREGERVTVEISTFDEWLEQSYGRMKTNLPPEVLEYLALDPEVEYSGDEEFLERYFKAKDGP